MDHYAQGLKLAAAGEHARAIEAFERALGANPSDIRVLFALGNTAKTLGMKPAAEEFYRRVLNIEPQRPEAVVNLANLLRSSARFAEAEALVGAALIHHPADPELKLTLGSIRRESGDAGSAISLYREVLSLRPGYVPALVNLADLLSDRGEDSEALALYDQALKTDPGNAQGRLNRAILHLLRGNLKDGWRDYAGRLNVPGKVPVPDHGLAPWSGGSLKKTRLLVTAEQGVGDHLMFASLIPELAARASKEGGSLLLECEPRLRPLFSRSFPGVATHDWQIEIRDGVVRSRYGWLKTAGGANGAIPMGSLPRYLRKTIDSFPNPHRYLTADPAETARWQAAFSHLPRPLVGLCWRSGAAGGERGLQFAPLENWAAMLSAMPGTAISVQYDAKPEEITAFKALSGREVIVPQGIDQKQELDRAAGLLAALDAVISAPTAVSWLSAGLGVTTFKTLYGRGWTSFGTGFEPFAPAVKCLFPQKNGDWADVLAQALDEIRSLAG
jgi:Tfp pilus assembly protein PilF